MYTPHRTRAPARRALALAVLGSVLMAAPASAQTIESVAAQARRVGDVGFDLLALRTTGFLTTVLGAAFLVPVAAITWPGGLHPLREALDHFVIHPGEFTFTRKLGDF